MRARYPFSILSGLFFLTYSLGACAFSISAIFVKGKSEQSNITLFAAAREGARSLGTIPSSQFIQIVRKDGEYYQVRTGPVAFSGRPAWVKKAAVEFHHLSQLQFTLIETSGKIIRVARAPLAANCGASCAGYLPVGATRILSLRETLVAHFENKPQNWYHIAFAYTAARKECHRETVQVPDYCHRTGDGWVEAKYLRTERRSGIPLVFNQNSKRIISSLAQPRPVEERQDADADKMTPYEAVAERLEGIVGSCMLKPELESELKDVIATHHTFDDFVELYPGDLSKEIGIRLSVSSLPAFDTVFLSGPRGWRNKKFPIVRVPFSQEFRSVASLRTLTAQEIVTIDALSRTLWSEMEDAAYYGGPRYFDAVGRVLQNRADAVSHDSRLKNSFAVASDSYPEIFNKYDPTHSLLDNEWLRVLRSPKQFSCWNNAGKGAVFPSLLKTLCPKITITTRTHDTWMQAVATATEMVLDPDGFRTRTPGLENKYFYSSRGAHLCGGKRHCPYAPLRASSVAGKKLNPIYMTVWKIQKEYRD